MTATKYRSIPVGRIPRLDRGGCRFESCLLYKSSTSVDGYAPAWAGQALTSNQEASVRISSAAHWFVSVKANTPDCLSGTTSSSLVRTADLMQTIVEWCNWLSISVFDTDGVGSSPASTTRLIVQWKNAVLRTQR